MVPRDPAGSRLFEEVSVADAFDAVRRTTPTHGTHDHREVEALISRARRHPLGEDFLLRGAHDAVAVTFGVHAFLVDAARDHLAAALSSDAAPAR
jgi:hypothetical protein